MDIMIIRMKKNLGFTLIEILVVIAITIILLGFSLSSYLGVQKTSRDNKRKVDLESIRSALEIYRSDCQIYPASWNLPAQAELFGCPPENNVSYISSVPNDPRNFEYNYEQTSDNSYCLCARMEVAGLGTDCGCAGECGGDGCNYFVTNP